MAAVFGLNSQPAEIQTLLPTAAREARMGVFEAGYLDKLLGNSVGDT